MLIKSPQDIGNEKESMYSVFLAGSIEMGSARDWQKQVEEEFATSVDVVLYNPRRDDWDSSWVQDISNETFKGQVEWELNAMDAADLIVMYFSPGTKSPVTLLELGLHASSGKLVVCCPQGFWRKGNVDIVCKRYGVAQVATIEQLIAIIYQRINKK